MDKDYFMNAGIPPPQLHFDTIPWSGVNCTAPEQFLNPNSDQFSHFDSALSSIVTSSAAAATSAPASEAFLLRELIGQLKGGSSSGAGAFAAATHNNDSNYSTPISSPKLHLTMLDQINLSPNLGNSVALTPPLPSLSSDPGFAERAAKFSCFGSRSFNGRTTTQLALNIPESQHRSKSPLMNAKLPRVSSTPALKQQAGSSPENKNFTEIRSLEKKLTKFSGSAANSNDESSLSDQFHSGETGSGSKLSNELNSRKRKGVSKSKPKENGSTKGAEGDDDGNPKRSKNENVDNKSDEETKGGSNDEQKANQKPPEPPKDYIHVRARRGQATDSHSLAERVRREKISERMKLLQDLVPGCNKVTGKALMLDEIINYVQSLQRQVEFLSMKLASVNPELDFNVDNVISKDMFQQNSTLPQQLYPMDSSAPPFYQQNVQQQMHNNTDVSGNLPLGFQLSSVDEFTENLPQFPGFSEDDLHSIVGFVHNSVNFHGLNQTSNMKIER